MWNYTCRLIGHRICMSKIVNIFVGGMYCVISKVLHTLRLLFKNKFILQNTFIGLQCNLHCALSQRSNVWANLVLLLGRPRCWCVWLLDNSSMLVNRFPRSGFFNFDNRSKADGLMSGLHGGWGSTCHLYISKISDTAPEAWGRAVMYDRWSLHKIWPQSVSSPLSRLRFAEQGPRGLPIRTQCSLLKSGSQLSWKSERLRHPTGRASAVCRTFEMTPVYIYDFLKCV